MTLSIALCTYNGARFLPAQLASFVAQTLLPDELVVCDDASTDGAIEVLTAFQKDAPFPMTIIRNEHNRGTAANFTQAISRCSGDIIALSDQDDAWLPEKMARLTEAFETWSDVGMLFSDALLTDADLVPHGGKLLEAFGVEAHTRKLLTDGIAFTPLLSRNLVTGATAAFRTHFRPLLLPMPGSGPLLHDAWIALLVAAVGQVRLLDEPLILYRQHPHQQTPLHVPMPRVRSESHYQAQWEQLKTLRRRLMECAPEFPPRSDALALLDAKIRHVGRRVALPPGRARRVWPVVIELARGGYHRYSNGWRSAARDLIYAK